MPIYTYTCTQCKRNFNEFRHIAERNEIPRCCGRVERILAPSMVMPDIAEYKAIAADKETGKCPLISGRKQHREFLYRNGYEELGHTQDHLLEGTQHDRSGRSNR